MIQLVVVVDFGGKGGQFGGGRCRIHLCRIVGAKAESEFCHCLTPQQRRSGSSSFGSNGFASKHTGDFFGSFIVI